MYQYGSPAAGTDGRPRCWGQSFNSEDPECRRCAYQASCRDQVIRSNVNRQQAVPVAPPIPAAAQQYFQNYAPPSYSPQPYQVPATTVVQVQPVPQPQPVPVRVAAPVPPRPPQQVQQGQTYPHQPIGMHDWYGRMQDPMMYTVHAAPAPFRPQMEGESFFERVAKNTALAMVEGFFAQMFLAVRQMVLPPPPRPVNGSHQVTGTADKSAP
jgi:hypothetical protein